jgi:hypothetical protein
MSTLLVGGGLDADVTVKVSVAVCVSVPDVPVKTTLAVPLAADADAVKLIGWPDPGESVKVVGEAVTPCGRLPRVTCTAPLKPFATTAVTVTA